MFEFGVWGSGSWFGTRDNPKQTAMRAVVADGGYCIGGNHACLQEHGLIYSMRSSEPANGSVAQRSTQPESFAKGPAGAEPPHPLLLLLMLLLVAVNIIPGLPDSYHSVSSSPQEAAAELRHHRHSFTCCLDLGLARYLRGLSIPCYILRLKPYTSPPEKAS